MLREETYSHFVSCLNVEHEVLNHVHFILGVDDMETWCTHTEQEAHMYTHSPFIKLMWKRLFVTGLPEAVI